ncbi:MAG: hypothetical protein J5504_07535 [Butyrivibrio sp.]|nr:hypothetical protein [Butyrivibrio sp.]
MKKNRLVCLSFPFIAVMAVACSGISAERQNTEIVADESAIVASEAAYELEDEETEYTEAEDAEFYCLALKDGEEKKVDIGSDGEMDTLFFAHPDGTGNDKSCYVQINDQKIDIELIEENGVIYGDADAIYVHRSDGDFLLITNSGAAGYGSVTLYMWDKGGFVEKDSLSDSYNIYSTFNEKTNNFEYDIDAQKMMLVEPITYFGCDWIEGEYCGYGSDGLMLPWSRYSKIYPVIEGADVGLILKKDITFIENDSGDGPKTGKAGQKIIPDGFSSGCMSFISEDGEDLGYIQDTDNPEELFENIGDFQVG